MMPDEFRRTENQERETFEINKIESGKTSAEKSCYTQSVSRTMYDKDITDVMEIVNILHNLVPLKMPVYNFNLNEINGELYYKPDGNPLLIREYDSDVIRDYYANPNPDYPEYSVSRILEHDKTTGRLKTKIEPVINNGCLMKTSITIFDAKINNKYILMQITEDGFVNNITEFSGVGKSFQSLFRNTTTLKPVRYLEGKDSEDGGFEMVDCIFDINGNVARIKRYNNKKEVDISYTDDKKNITVKTSN